MSLTALLRDAAGTDSRGIGRDAETEVNTSLGSLRVQVTDDIPSVAPVWEALQRRAPCTPPQTYSWARAWARHMRGPQLQPARRAGGPARDRERAARRARGRAVVRPAG